MISHGSVPSTVKTCEEYLEYLLSHSKKLKESNTDNSGHKVNIADTHYIKSYLPEDLYYDKATNLAAYMDDQDVDMIHSMLECNQALCDGRPNQNHD